MEKGDAEGGWRGGKPSQSRHASQHVSRNPHEPARGAAPNMRTTGRKDPGLDTTDEPDSQSVSLTKLPRSMRLTRSHTDTECVLYVEKCP